MTSLTTLFAGALAALVLAALAYGAVYTSWVERRWPGEGRMVATRAGPIHVVERGDGPVALLVHGASANNRELRSALEAPLVAAGFRVVAMDRPGFGDSPAFTGRVRLARHADAVAALIEAEGLRRPIVVAHSYGGAVALRLALDHSELVGGLVLLSPATHGDVGPVAWYNHVGATPGAGWLFARAVAPIAGPMVAPDGLDGTFAPRAAPADHAKETGVGLVFRPRVFAANAADLSRANVELRAQQERYGDVDAPVAIISGAEDSVVLTAGHSERTAAAIEDARLMILPGVGHMPHHAAPDLVVEHVRAIRDGLDADAAERAAS